MRVDLFFFVVLLVIVFSNSEASTSVLCDTLMRTLRRCLLTGRAMLVIAGPTHSRTRFAMPVCPLRKQLLGVVLGSGLLLLVPLVAGQFSSEVNWGAGDFAAAAFLLVGAGFAIVFVARFVGNRGARAATIAAIVLVLAVVWAELAVGLLT